MNNAQKWKVKFFTKSTEHKHFDAIKCNKKYWKCQKFERVEAEYYFLDNKNDFKLKVSDHRKCPMAYGNSESTVVNIYLMSINTS